MYIAICILRVVRRPSVVRRRPSSSVIDFVSPGVTKWVFLGQITKGWRPYIQLFILILMAVCIFMIILDPQLKARPTQLTCILVALRLRLEARVERVVGRPPL